MGAVIPSRLIFENLSLGTAKLMNKDKTAVIGCCYWGDMVVCMRKINFLSQLGYKG